MAVRGRKPTATVIKLATGNPGRRPLPKHEPESAGRPVKPPKIGKRAGEPLGAAADPSRRGRDLARRRDPAGQSRWCRGCPRRSTDMARNGSCLAHVPPGADGREAGDPGGRRLHPRGDGGVAFSNGSPPPTPTTGGFTKRSNRWSAAIGSFARPLPRPPLRGAAGIARLPLRVAG